MKARWFVGANSTPRSIESEYKVKDDAWQTRLAIGTILDCYCWCCLPSSDLLTFNCQWAINQKSTSHIPAHVSSFFHSVSCSLALFIFVTTSPSSPNYHIPSKHVSPSPTYRARSHDWKRPRFPKRPQFLDSHEPAICPHVWRQAVQEPYSTPTRLHYPMGSQARPPWYNLQVPECRCQDHTPR
jgi:hypothetical protein